ncbi:gluconate:H+ symporter [Aurantimonas sp. 22II-16-19i]|uniref:GntP family permease n=1 Tax=Aurantimonas sp. 22II-16-19i TaxID=1317114 RepID=UPI0009F7A4A0|nr:gluconate:H+ symporter [Aurantimonas sp. 22II-16-19i]ORE97683.1 gluconate transporter [Aurantimonas sp. 22II-16-19i]
MPEGFQQTLGAGSLLAIAAGAIVLLLVLIIQFRVHAFIALVLVSLATAFVAGLPSGEVLGVLTSGFGSTLASVALLVGFGAMLGRLVEVSGGAQTLSDALIAKFGEDRAPLALGIASLVFGFPIFFDAGLVVMLPIVFSVARRLGGGILRYALPVAGAFSCMHAFVPPHPGPVASAELLGADIGILTIVGLIVTIPTWFVASYLYGLWAGKKFVLPVPDFLSGGEREEDMAEPPQPSTVILLLLLPLAIIFVNTGLDAARAAGMVDGEAGWFQFLRAICATPIALLIAVLVASYVLGTRRGLDKLRVESLLNSALGPVCAIILITGAGGMFGGVLRATGIGDALASTLEGVGLPLIVSGFLIALALRVAQGSATVALITAAGLIQPAIAAQGITGFPLAAIVVALASGSLALSHVNDSGFWLVGRFMDMDVKTTLKTWTVMETLIGVVGFAIACLLYVAFGG